MNKYIQIRCSTHESTRLTDACRRCADRIAVACLLLLFSVHHAFAADQKQQTLVLGGPPAVVSFPFLHMIESGALDDVAQQVRFELWTNPDQLRISVLQGQTDFTALPTNVAANLASRGAPLRLLNVSTWGILWMVSRDADRSAITDFRGERIAIPFRGDMPDVLFGLLAEAAGMDPKKDFQVHYVASPLDAVSLIMARRIKHALLAEPAVSMLFHKTTTFPGKVIAPDLHRAFSLRKEWGRVFATANRIPQAGIAAVGKQDSILESRVAAAYEESLNWCLEYPAECGEVVARHIDRLSPEAVANALRVSPMQALPTRSIETELRHFFQQLHARDPGLIGGRLPDDSFYAFDGARP